MRPILDVAPEFSFLFVILSNLIICVTQGGRFSILCQVLSLVLTNMHMCNKTKNPLYSSRKKTLKSSFKQLTSSALLNSLEMGQFKVPKQMCKR